MLVAGGGIEPPTLGFMNHHPGKTLSICLFESCSHREFRPILHSLRFLTVASPCCAVYFGHKLDTTFFFRFGSLSRPRVALNLNSAPHIQFLQQLLFETFLILTTEPASVWVETCRLFPPYSKALRRSLIPNMCEPVCQQASKCYYSDDDPDGNLLCLAHASAFHVQYIGIG
jgi:hypothetical protein